MNLPHAQECQCRLCEGKCRAMLYSGALCHNPARWRVGLGGYEVCHAHLMKITWGGSIPGLRAERIA